MPVTPLLGTRFGGPPGFISGRQAKIWFPTRDFSAANLSVAIAARARQRPAVPSFAPHDPGGPVDVGDPPLPVDWSWIIEEPVGSGDGVYPVLPGPVGDPYPSIPAATPRPPPIPEPPRTDAEVFQDDEVVEYEEGDWPAGSIFAPGEIWGPAPAEPNPLDEDEEVMAHDWGHLGRQVLGGLFGGEKVDPYAIPPIQPMGYTGAIGGTGPTQIPGGRAAMPPSGSYRYTADGRVVRCRRRRPRLLTDRDLKDLAALKTITGNNDALKMAVIKAVR